jgi:hypothetical protein
MVPRFGMDTGEGKFLWVPEVTCDSSVVRVVDREIVLKYVYLKNKLGM